jgi:DNA-binding LytR/AlgR family response regulator
MSTITIGVVENEMVIADTICLTLRKLGYNVLPSAPNYNLAVKMIAEHKPDLLLLDINLGGQKDGIDVAVYARQSYTTPIIFLTANSDKATVERAKIVKPNAYLVKPFTKEDLYSAIEIAISNYFDTTTPTTQQEYILVKDGYDFIKILYNDILYISSEQNYVGFNLANNKKIMVRSTLQEMADKLSNKYFIKLNRSFIINVQQVTKLETEKVWIDTIPFAIIKPIHDFILQKMQP